MKYEKKLENERSVVLNAVKSTGAAKLKTSYRIS